ncbi:STAS domain-containing protein [Streptomyces sp. NPDC048330]|uniref:STAS domain-containing protein n=1 Tax=Streptomyces sp. NPDC048330 TaxID=3365533 RepID=UPI0037192511
MAVRREERGTVFVLRGEIDFRSAVRLDEAARGALEPECGHGPVVVDLAALTFCDSSGISALLRLYRRLTAHHRELRLAAVPRNVLRLFSLTGLDQVFAVHPDVPGALAGDTAGADTSTGAGPTARPNREENA